jgi:C1A family cysteine protease
MTEEQIIKNLQEENQKLKDKLVDFKKLEEDLIADKVFKKAKDKLVGWYTVGGIALFGIGIIGVKSVVDYSKELVSKRLETYSEAKINQLIVGESHKQVEALITRQEDTLTLQFQALYEDAKKRLDISKNGYGILEVGSSKPSNTADEVSKLDLSPQLNPVRNQGSEGSTVAFTIATVLENALYQKDHIKVSISPRYIYNGINNKNDGGAFFVDAFNFLSTTGAVEESAWPYRAGDFSNEPPASVNNARHFKISRYRTLKIDVNTFKSVLVAESCIAAGITVYNSMYVVKNGVYGLPGKNDKIIGGSGVCIVGFDDEKQMFKFRNSWGTAWGDKGYGYIRYSDINKLLTDAYIIAL